MHHIEVSDALHRKLEYLVLQVQGNKDEIVSQVIERGMEELLEELEDAAIADQRHTLNEPSRPFTAMTKDLGLDD